MSIINEDIRMSSPYYVTRPEAGEGKRTGSLSMSIWMQLVFTLVIWLNVMFWGSIGLVEAGVHVVGWL